MLNRRSSTPAASTSRTPAAGSATRLTINFAPAGATPAGAVIVTSPTTTRTPSPVTGTLTTETLRAPPRSPPALEDEDEDETDDVEVDEPDDPASWLHPAVTANTSTHNPATTLDPTDGPLPSRSGGYCLRTRAKKQPAVRTSSVTAAPSAASTLALPPSPAYPVSTDGPVGPPPADPPSPSWLP